MLANGWRGTNVPVRTDNVLGLYLHAGWSKSHEFSTKFFRIFCRQRPFTMVTAAVTRINQRQRHARLQSQDRMKHSRGRLPYETAMSIEHWHRLSTTLSDFTRRRLPDNYAAAPCSCLIRMRKAHAPAYRHYSTLSLAVQTARFGAPIHHHHHHHHHL